jgi:hypothetical protein
LLGLEWGNGMKRDEAEGPDTDFAETTTLEQRTPDPIEDYDGETTEILSEKYRRLVEDDF